MPRGPPCSSRSATISTTTRSARDRAFRLTFDPYAEEEFSFSPDGRQAAFVRRNNLFVVNLEQQRQEKQLTTSGTEQMLNGKLDWVYQEEIYGRGNFRAYWWSPDSSHLAFLQLDDRPVPEFTVVDHIPARLTVEQWDYPKAGDPNPLVKLGVVPVVGGHVQWVDLAKYSAIEFLIVNVGWTPDSSHVVYQVQNREQYWLDVNIVTPSGQAPKTLFRETTKAWVDPIGRADMAEGRIVPVDSATDPAGGISIATSTDGTHGGPVTHGEWDIRAFHGVDEPGGWIVFLGRRTKPHRLTSIASSSMAAG